MSAGITRRRIRQAHALIYSAAAVSLLLAAFADGGPPQERLAAGGTALVTALIAVSMAAWARVPDWVLVAAFPFAGLTVTAIAVVDPPLALTPMYYVPPLMTSAYFLRPTHVALSYAAVCLSFGAAMLFAVHEGPRLIQWVTVVSVGGVVVAFVGHLKAALEERVDRLERLAAEDPLTGALNRRGLMDGIDVEIARATRADRPCSLAVLDVDHFKDINDRFGHAAGDEALQDLVTVVTGRLRRGDLLGRLGGEEFGVLLADTDTAGAELYADELRSLLEEATAADGRPLTVSVGIASIGEATVTAECLVAAADDALYVAKRAGRNTVRAAA